MLSLLLLASIWQAQSISFNSSVKTFLSADDPVRLDYLKFEQQYGLSAYFIVLVQDPELFSEQGIERLRQLQQALIDHVDHLASAESIINARTVSSVDDDISIEPFLLDQAISNQQLQEKKQFALNTPYFKNHLINHDGSAAVILLRIERYSDLARQHKVDVTIMQQMMQQINTVLKQQQHHYQKPLLLGGSPTIGAELTKTTHDEMLFFSFLAVIVVAFSLFMIFKRLSAVVLPLVCLLSCILMVLALMTAMGYSVQVSSVILPSFLLGVGVADAIHFLRSFYPAFKQSGDKQQAIMSAIDHTGVAMFFTTITTAAGLVSFSNSNVVSIANFGYFAAIGSVLAYVLTIISLPALLTVLPVKQQTRLKANTQLNEQWVSAYVLWLNRYYKPVLAGGCVVLLVSLFFASHISFKLDVMQWFDKSHPIRAASEQIDQQMAGTMQVEILLSNQGKQKLNAAQLQTVDDWLAHIQKNTPDDVTIGSVVSILNLLKESNKVLQNSAQYQLPDNDALLAQELLLLQFDGNARVNQLINSDMSQMRITLSVPWLDSLKYDHFVKLLEQDFQNFTGQQFTIKMTGMATLSNQAFKEMVRSMLVSYVYAGVAILLLMMFLVRNASLGFWTMLIPNITPIALLLAIMYWLGIALDMFTVLIGTIAMGLIVDDTIHLTYSFQQFFKATGSATQALIRSIITTGKALVSTSIILCCAFLIYGFSSLSNLEAFGFLTALCIALALVGDLLLLPALLLLMYKNKKI